MYGEVDKATLEKLTEAKNDLGEITESWATADTFPARLHQLRADRRYESNRNTGIVEWRLYVDVDKVSVDIDRTQHRIKYDGITYQIESVNDIDKLGNRYQVDLLRTD